MIIPVGIPLILLAIAFVLIKVYPLNRTALEDIQHRITERRTDGPNQKDDDQNVADVVVVPVDAKTSLV